MPGLEGLLLLFAFRRKSTIVGSSLLHLFKSAVDPFPEASVLVNSLKVIYNLK